jgi:hypothetical protein
MHLAVGQCGAGARVAGRASRGKLRSARQPELLGSAEARVGSTRAREQLDRAGMESAARALQIGRVWTAAVRTLVPVEAEPAQVFEQARD